MPSTGLLGCCAVVTHTCLIAYRPVLICLFQMCAAVREAARQQPSSLTEPPLLHDSLSGAGAAQLPAASGTVHAWHPLPVLQATSSAAAGGGAMDPSVCLTCEAPALCCRLWLRSAPPRCWRGAHELHHRARLLLVSTCIQGLRGIRPRSAAPMQSAQSPDAARAPPSPPGTTRSRRARMTCRRCCSAQPR